MVVDIQCGCSRWPTWQSSFIRNLITTLSKAKIFGAEHVEFEDEHALEAAKKIIMMAIENYKNRDNNKVFIPSDAEPSLVAGFSHETIKIYAGRQIQGKLPALNDNIMNGRIRGVVGIAGCTSPKAGVCEQSYVEMAKELIANNFLVIATGCAAAMRVRGLIDSRNEGCMWRGAERGL